MEQNNIHTKYELSLKLEENPQKVHNWFLKDRDVPEKYIPKLANLFDKPHEIFFNPEAYLQEHDNTSTTQTSITPLQKEVQI